MTTKHQMWISPVVPLEQLSLLNLHRDRKGEREEQRNGEMKKTGGVIFRQLHV